MNIYKGIGDTPQEAFESLWDLMKYTEDYKITQNGDKWQIELRVAPPKKDEP